MKLCTNCGSYRTVKKGPTFHQGLPKWRYRCNQCEKPFYSTEIPPPASSKASVPHVPKTKKLLEKPPHSGQRTWVITSATNDVPVRENFFKTLKNFCFWNDAELLIVPIKYQQGLNESGGYSWDERLHEFIAADNITLLPGLRLLADTRIHPAIGNPLTGFECFSKGDSLILAHSQLMMKSIAVSHVDPSAIITTTGSLTEPVYTHTKQGEKAAFNHSICAILVEEDVSIKGFHFRVLNADENGSFYDLDRYYDGNNVYLNTDIPAIVLGDEHIIHADASVTQATLTGTNSIVNVLRPKIIVRHDSLDFYSANHHHQKNVFTQYAKFISGKNKAEDELALTVAYVKNTTPDFSTSVIVSSNHNEALLRWLQECNPKLEPWNALLYHELTFLMLKQTKMAANGATYPNAFELWAKHNFDTGNIRFVNSYESFKVEGIELAYHGDKGVNGSRGSVAQFSKLGRKSISGHSHSAQIFGGAYQVGHSCLAKLEYNQGPSSWSQAHCLIHKNGKRQMVFVIGGKWRR